MASVAGANSTVTDLILGSEAAAQSIGARAEVVCGRAASCL
jgi:hypothetical protein